MIAGFLIAGFLTTFGFFFVTAGLATSLIGGAVPEIASAVASIRLVVSVGVSALASGATSASAASAGATTAAGCTMSFGGGGEATGPGVTGSLAAGAGGLPGIIEYTAIPATIARTPPTARIRDLRSRSAGVLVTGAKSSAPTTSWPQALRSLTGGFELGLGAAGEVGSVGGFGTTS